ncbi:MAG: OmpA family protein, partial [Devosiaceae bacterium]|nr:OmpA family protein [Devosiaceae bacterium]
KLSIARFTESKTILFAPASAQLTAESVRNIVELAVSLNRCEQSPIYVSGHTDSDGPAEDNMALSVARAEAVVVALIEAGVDDSRLYAVGYGETLPVATNDTRAGKALNRRIVFELGDE